MPTESIFDFFATAEDGLTEAVVRGHFSTSLLLAVLLSPFLRAFGDRLYSSLDWAWGKVLCCGRPSTIVDGTWTALGDVARANVAAEGLSLRESLELDWAGAKTRASLGRCSGVLAAALRLLLWHWLQPLTYLTALLGYWSVLGPSQRVLGVAVAVKEVVYLCEVGWLVWARPGFLLASMPATWADAAAGGWPNDMPHPAYFDPARRAFGSGPLVVVLFVLAPERIAWVSLNVLDADAASGALPPSYRPCVWRLVGYGGALLTPLLDLCAVVALLTGLGAASAPLPLMVGYSLTALASTTMIVRLRAPFGPLPALLHTLTVLHPISRRLSAAAWSMPCCFFSAPCSCLPPSAHRPRLDRYIRYTPCSAAAARHLSRSTDPHRAARVDRPTALRRHGGPTTAAARRGHFPTALLGGRREALCGGCHGRKLRPRSSKG